MTRLDDGATKLRSGYSLWQAGRREVVETVRPDGGRVLDADVAIVGAGITGAFLAERFTRSGRRVVIVDRHAPATGSTAASTAMLLWELDSSLLTLEDRLGIEKAGRIANGCRQQVQGIAALVNGLGLDCDFRPRPSLYLAGDTLDVADLREERRLRAALGIAGDFIDEGGLAMMGLRGEGALVYDGSAEADPVKLARGLLAVAEARGAIILSPATAMVYETITDGIAIETREGDIIRARKLVLANGYEMPDFVPAGSHRLVTSWAIATEPFVRPEAPWPHQALVWEASDAYLYMRATADGRVIAGGEDEEFSDASLRERMTPQKVYALLANAAARCPGLSDVAPAFVWSGVFGVTEDSLPLIGPVPGRRDCLAAFGYGGNGITFSAMAAELLEAELEGSPHPDAGLYAIDRG